MYVIANGVLQENPYLDLKARRPAFTDAIGLGTGFSAIAFHPEFATNGRFYTTHTERAGSGVADFRPPVSSSITYQWVLAEWTSSDPSANTFSGTSRDLIRADVPGTKHGFQDMGFNPNAAPGDEDYGLLYLGIGDGSRIGQLENDNVQNLASFLGTIFRIDPLGTSSANGQYGIPPTNPFASDGDPNTLGEIWVYGFRDAHRISWDSGGDGLPVSNNEEQEEPEEPTGELPIASASASSFQSANRPENAIDGDLSTRWSARGRGEWIQFDLAAPSTLGAVEIA